MALYIIIIHFVVPKARILIFFQVLEPSRSCYSHIKLSHTCIKLMSRSICLIFKVLQTCILSLQSLTHSHPACHKVNPFVASSLFLYNIVPISPHFTVFRFYDNAKKRYHHHYYKSSLNAANFANEPKKNGLHVMLYGNTFVCHALLSTII